MQAKHAVVLTIDEMGEGGGETRYYSFHLCVYWQTCDYTLRSVNDVTEGITQE